MRVLAFADGAALAAFGLLAGMLASTLRGRDWIRSSRICGILVALLHMLDISFNILMQLDGGFLLPTAVLESFVDVLIPMAWVLFAYALVREQLESDLLGEHNKLEEARAEWAQTFRCIGQPAMLLDPSFRVIAVNDETIEATGLPGSKLIGRHCYEIMHGSNAPPDRCPLARMLRAGRLGPTEEEMEAHGRILMVNCSPVLSPEGALRRIIHVATDITERVRAEAERRRLEKELRGRQRLDAVGTLASGVAHEINNPINGVINYAQLMLDELPATDPARAHCREIIHESERIATIVRNLLTFARAETGGMVESDLPTVVEGALSLVRMLLRRDHIELVVEAQEGLPRVYCHEQQVQQVVMNVVTNARDALNRRYPGYDPDKRIWLKMVRHSEEGKSYARLTVEDHGCGIPAAVRERLFDPFFTTKNRTEGTGLGLSICHGIMREHGGRLSVESEEGAWTRFHADFPADHS